MVYIHDMYLLILFKLSHSPCAVQLSDEQQTAFGRQLKHAVRLQTVRDTHRSILSGY